MIILAGTIRVPTDKLAEAQPHFERLIAASRAEPGCLAYAFAHDALEPGLIRVFEIYQDAAAVDAHRQSPHFLAWRAANPSLGVGDRAMSHYDVSAARKL